MGLDVYLCYFEDLDTDAIVQFGRFVYEPHDSEGAKAGGRPSLAEKARELGLPPERVIGKPHCGGVEVSFPSKKHPNTRTQVGEWTSSYTYYFGDGDSMVYGRDMYYVFPEAKGDPHYIKPDWHGARSRLLEVLAEFQKLDVKSSDGLEYKGQTLTWFFERMEIILETIEYVLAQKDPGRYLLCWSA